MRYIDPNLLHEVVDKDSLLRLLADKLDWDINPNPDLALYEEPEISSGVKFGAKVKVYSLARSPEENRWLILLAEFDQEYVRRDLRNLLKSLRHHNKLTGRFPETSGYGDTIFIVTTPGYEDVRYILFEEREGRSSRIRSFGWDKKFIGRTVLTHNLERLQWQDRDDWWRAWDIQGLTDDFYKEFIKVFNEVKAATTHPGGEDKKYAYVQQLLNRLLFISFVERMGWLRTPDENSDYLHAQWLRFQNRDKKDMQDEELIPETFNDLLNRLFFDGLDNPNGVHPGDQFYPILGEVPYLNGGLFSRETDIDVNGVTVQDEVFDLILGAPRNGFDGGLFRRFNFTVTESTPLDQEVAVDPEMLGTIFERLVTGRHETGAYYTPRPVVSFMVKQALKGYLEEAGLPSEKVGPLVDFHEVKTLEHPEIDLAIKALKAVRAVDPACGSGAYLMGLHQEIFDMIDALVLTFEERDPSVLYHRKLRLLQDTIHGVDIDSTAVRIARLRLWLSLVVENYDIKPEPLPHLDFKIEQGDSLTFLVQRPQDQSTAIDNLLEDFTQAKIDSDDPDYDGSRGGREERRSLAFQLREDLRSYNSSYGSDAFNWRAEFLEVLGKGKKGFDIVLANPPYVRADAKFEHLLPDKKAQQEAIERWKTYRSKLKNTHFYETLHEKWDLYIPFLERAYQLLRSGGQMVFIISDAYNGNKYAARSHKFFLEHTCIERIDFCSEIDLFDAKINNTILHFAKTTPNPACTPVRVRRWGKNREEFDKNAETLPTAPQMEFGTTLFKMIGRRNEAAGEGTIPLEQVCYISKGMVIHAEEKKHHGEFTAEDVLSNVCDRLHPKRFVLGKDVLKWRLRNLRYLEWGTSRAPAHFSRPTFPEFHEAKEKLVTVRTPGSIPKTVYDNDSLHFDASSVGFVPWHLLAGVRNKSIRKAARYPDEIKRGEAPPAIYRDGMEERSRQFDLKYLLGIMNSEYARAWLTNQRRNKTHIYPDDWKKLPIKVLSHEAQRPIVDIVERILSAKKADARADVSELEMMLNDRINFLYLHQHGDEIYEEWLARKEAEKGTAVEEIRKLLAIGHETDGHEYKSSFAWDMKKDERADYLRDEVHTAICAFLNAGGGVLLIGVDDDGNVLGLEKDLAVYRNKDKLVQAIEAVFGKTLAPNPVDLVKIDFVEMDGKTVCRVRVQGDDSAMYKFKDNIFVRRNSGSKPALTAEEAAYWWRRRQKGEV